MVPVQKNDMLFVDAGTVNAMGPGVVILETQQTSDLTYRMYDYGRPRSCISTSPSRPCASKPAQGKFLHAP